MRFGAEYVEAALTAQERQLMVMESSEVKDDLVQDMIEVLTSCCALYGRFMSLGRRPFRPQPTSDRA
jgi:putative resolvase